VSDRATTAAQRTRTPRSIAVEKKTVAAMVRLYCADHHEPARGALCDECRWLLAYSHDRLDRCPYGGDKPSCKQCPVHCYLPDPREAMRQVMRYAGPKMLFRHPWLAVVHLWKDRARRSVPLPKARARRTIQAERP
jgi:hypothetical protein